MGDGKGCVSACESSHVPVPRVRVVPRTSRGCRALSRHALKEYRHRVLDFLQFRIDSRLLWHSEQCRCGKSCPRTLRIASLSCASSSHSTLIYNLLHSFSYVTASGRCVFVFFVVANLDLVIAKDPARSTVREAWQNRGFDCQVN